MRKLVTSALAGLALVGTTIGAAMPAEAQRGGFHGGGGFRGGGGWHGGGGWRGGGYHRGWGGGGAVAAGIIGLGVGAALASRPYYGRGYGYAPGYAYGYGAPYGYGGCYTTQRWDPYYGGYVPVRYCD